MRLVWRHTLVSAGVRLYSLTKMWSRCTNVQAHIGGQDRWGLKVPSFSFSITSLRVTAQCGWSGLTGGLRVRVVWRPLNVRGVR